MTVAPAAANRPRTLADLPAPRGLPWLGNIHQLDTRRLHQVLEDWQRDLGPMYRVQFGGRPVLVCSDSNLMQTVLRERPHRYRRLRAIESVLAEMGGNGVFSAEGEAWLPQRKLVMQALAATHFRSFFPTLVRITERLRHRWAGAAARGEVIEMREELTRYTVDVTTTLAFGEDPNTLEDSGDVIQRHLALIFPMIMSRINSPYPYWRRFRLPRDRALDKALAAVQAHIGGLIERNRQRLQQAPGAEPANLLQALLAARDESGSRFTDAEVSANVLTLLLAGEDTTAISLAWCMPYLAADPVLQRRMQADADALFGEGRVCPRHEDVRRLDLFEAVVTESLRLRPTVPGLFIEPLQDVELGGLALPARTVIWFILRPDMLDERHFGDPTSFRPDRWLRPHPGDAGTAATPEAETAADAARCPVAHGAMVHGPAGTEALAHNPRAHLQFGAGPRVCPGRHLAAVEMRLVLSMLARNFEVELACEPHEIREVLAFTMMPERMPVRLHARH